MSRFAVLFVALAVGCARSANETVVEVSASYPGANAKTVADTVAAPIEQQVHGAKGLRRIESESKCDGSYTARVHFVPGTDPTAALQVVRERVALAEPTLPEAVRAAGTDVKPLEPGIRSAAIALVDAEDRGLEALTPWAETVRKKADGVVRDPVLFPGPDVKRSRVTIDREKAVAVGVSVEAISEVVRKAGKASADDLRKLTVPGTKGDVPFGSVATVTEEPEPAAVYRVDLRRAIRLTGEPPDGETPARVSAKLAALAESLREGKGLSVVDLSGR